MSNRIGVIAIALSAAVGVLIGVALSQPPSPRPLVRSQAPQDKTSSQERRPDNTPSPVVQTPTQQQGQGPTQKTRPEENESSANWWDWFIDKGSNWVIVALTFVLSVVGVLQWWATSTLAKHNAVIERAYVTLSHHPPGLQIAEYTISGGGRSEPERNATVAVSVKNFGNTPANITYALVNLHISAEPLPDKPPYDESGVKRLWMSSVKGDEFTIYRSFVITDKKLADIQSPATLTAAYVIGYADYIDKFDVRHRTGFARYYNPVTDDLRLYEDAFGKFDQKAFGKRNNLLIVTEPYYNYDRERKKGEGNDWDEPTNQKPSVNEAGLSGPY